MIFCRFFSVALWVFLLVLAPYAKAQESVQVPRQDGAKVPIRVFQPSGQGCSSLALISPGAGGTENGMTYLAEGLRQKGWMVIVIGHKDSGPAAVRADTKKAGLAKGILALVSDPKAYKSRFMDIRAVLDWARERCKPTFTALIGHSMGAATVMLEAGAKNKLGLDGQNDFDAYAALSPFGPGPVFPAGAWRDIHKPMIVLTGTRDKTYEGDWKVRVVPFGDMPPGCKWLGVIQGATHLNFAGVGFARKTEKLTVRFVSLFLDNLRKGGCGTPPAESGITVESK